MEPAPSPPFAAMLRRYRLAAGLSQADLAERAGLSVEAIGALERGVRRAPYRATVEMLAEALALAPDERARPHAAVARRRAPALAPPIRPDPARTNLPAPVTSFIGRERAQATILRLLESARLLTLTGAGGIGKTRLATQVAAGAAAQYTDGVFLVELAALADPALVPQAAARALDLREEPDRSLMETIAAALREREMLLILDNCEHLRDAAAALAETLLGAAPRLRILATSREALGIVGETIWRVPSLALPTMEEVADGAPRHTARSVAGAEAGRLFVARATAAYPAFALTDENAAAVAAICRRLDGIPLALELAAARARILAPEQIAARLDERFRLLTGGAPGAPPRQQTLRAALDWSYDLLTARERALLERLAVFPGGCEIEAAEAVCADGDLPPGPLPAGRGSLSVLFRQRDADNQSAAVSTHGNQRDGERGSPSLQGGGRGVGQPFDLFALLTSLVEQSLVTVEYRGDAARYRLPETIRHYAGERLAASDGADATRARQVAWALDLAEGAAAHLHGPEQATWLVRLDAEHDNLRAALQHTLDCDDIERGFRLATAIQGFWRVRGYLSEAGQWLDRLLSRGASAPAAMRATALHGAAVVGQMQGDRERACRMAEAALATAREAGEDRLIASALHYLGVLATDIGDHAAARRYLDGSLALARTLGDPSLIRPPLYNLGTIELHRGNLGQAEAHFQEALSFARAAGDPGGMASILTALGFVARHGGVVHQARAQYAEALRLRRQLGDRAGIANCVRLLADLEASLGEFSAARAHANEALSIARAIGHAWGVVSAYDVLTFAARRQGDLPAARDYARSGLLAARSLDDRKRIHGALWEYAAVAALADGDAGAVRVFAASESLRDAIGFVLGADHVDEMARAMDAVRDRIGETAFEEAWIDGAALSPEQALAYALNHAERARCGSPGSA